VLYNNKLAFVHLQKTGGTHISRVLEKVDSFDRGPKHGRLQAPIHGNQHVIGSIRDPFSYYVSLWSYGCLRKGGLFERLITRNHFGIKLKWYKQAYHTSIGSLFIDLWDEATRSTSVWQKVYAEKTKENFNLWLLSILDSRNSKAIGENYFRSPISEHSGLLTFRYVLLYIKKEAWIFEKEKMELDTLLTDWGAMCMVDDFIHQHDLTGQLLSVLEKLNYTLSDELTSEIKSMERTNSSGSKPFEDFYTAENYQLVKNRERLIILQHGY